MYTVQTYFLSCFLYINTNTGTFCLIPWNTTGFVLAHSMPIWHLVCVDWCSTAGILPDTVYCNAEYTFVMVNLVLVHYLTVSWVELCSTAGIYPDTVHANMTFIRFNMTMYICLIPFCCWHSEFILGCCNCIALVTCIMYYMFDGYSINLVCNRPLWWGWGLFVRPGGTNHCHA